MQKRRLAKARSPAPAPAVAPFDAAKATASPALIKLRSFTPGKDPLPLPHRGPASAVTVVGDAWRIENTTDGGNFNVMVAQDLRDLPKYGVLVFRAKVKVEPKHKDAWGSLAFGAADHVFISWDQWPSVRARYDGHDKEWTEKEVRYPVAQIEDGLGGRVPVRGDARQWRGVAEGRGAAASAAGGTAG